MTPEQVELVQGSFAKVAPIAPQAADIFYTRLFELSPEMRTLFPDDLAEQKRKLMTMLGVAVNGLSRPEAIIPAVEELGRNHVGYGVRKAHFEVVGQAMLDTLARGLGEAFTPDVRDAWAGTYALLSGVMIAAAEEVSS
jgi:hemoglobin-like flavoprotein